MVDKVIRDGKVAVLYSPGYGAGWYSWEPRESKLYNPKLVEAIKNGAPKEVLLDIANKQYPDDYNNGAKDLQIQWIPLGTQFKIDEYDGYESIVYNYDVNWIVA